jgi:hypothetical protein
MKRHGGLDDAPPGFLLPLGPLSEFVLPFLPYFR